MTGFDYTGGAGLFAGRVKGSSGSLRYRRFDTAAEALRFAIEDMPGVQQRGSLLETDEARFDHNQIRALYDAPDYPLSRRIIGPHAAGEQPLRRKNGRGSIEVLQPVTLTALF
ncbi:hypothetical protein [Rhizobium sp. YK2]|uniref:hypothetical protein n=1 Tax=Rhizobium sp. YK2 TaxID=1860096 RepID=UPI00084C364F|nr:hypothetical protein [Rhizobium sp. YK2]OEC96913.1 hypothetical protein A9Z06_28330 [Rhizobium sp. YK2]